MDTKHGIPGLALGDPMSLVAQYSKDMQSALAPVAGRREGVLDSALPSGQTVVPMGGFAYQLGGVSPGSGGGISVPSAGIYYVAAGLRISNSADGELQLRIDATDQSGRLAIQSGRNARHFSASTTALLTAGATVNLQVYNGGSANTADEYFDGLPYLSVALIREVDL